MKKDNRLKNKNSVIAGSIWTIIIVGIVSFLCLIFYPINDDLVFANMIKDKTESFAKIITVNGVNGRYIGNLLGVFFSWISITPFWYIRAVFNTICVLALFYYMIKAVGLNLKALFFVPALMLTPHIQHFRQYYGFSAVFMNYLLPLLLLFINIYLIKKYICKKKKDSFIIIISVIAFFNCFFIEHITVLIFLCSLVALIYSIIKKKYVKLCLSLFASNTLGMVAMFSHSLIMPANLGYRDSVLSKGILWIFDNITNNISFVIFDHLFFTVFISIICFVCIIKYTRKKKGFQLLSVFMCLILALSSACSFLLYFGSWEGTVFGIFVNKYFVTAMTLLFLISFGLVIFLYLPDEKKSKDIYFYYIAIWPVCGMLCVVSPIGQRCFMIVYAFLVIVSVKILNGIFDEIKKVPKIVFFTFCLIFFCVSVSNSCVAYYTGRKVMNERFAYIEDQMSKGAESVILPDSVNFTDCGGLDYLGNLYYYNTPNDLRFEFVPYEQWPKNK